ncbi:LOW QUALITY PROTEIN: uncharacterized protein LOC119555206 [Drosophila subpulchrella]|uniref:LOW QUALITY PROTEIN: uncharacterized protein LOC119555206 n=1 Tax=Drosophila subpulchrella TaxID=1486046 RepID=UPI0018A1629F|nr:LOW QUALITY PROTEIN: uncharacterized protein LOC119555206 [Drosophila subpulchrella]
MQAKSSSSAGNNNCNQNKDAALLTLKPAQGQSTKSGHAHEFRHGGGGDDDGDDVAMRCDAMRCSRQTAYCHRRPASPEPQSHRQPLPAISHLQEQR